MINNGNRIGNNVSVLLQVMGEWGGGGGGGGLGLYNILGSLRGLKGRGYKKKKR